MKPILCPKCQSEKIVMLERYLTTRQPIGIDDEGMLWFEDQIAISWDAGSEATCLHCDNCHYDWEVPKSLCFN